MNDPDQESTQLPSKNESKLFPKKPKTFKKKEAVSLRRLFLIMFPCRLLIIIGCDIMAYKFEIMSLIIDIILLFLDYNNYMRLDKVFILCECLCMLLTSLIALSHIQRIFE